MNKRIFLVIPTLHQGGAERVISELANYFSACGIDVHLVLLAKGEPFYTVSKNVTIHQLGFINKRKRKLQKIYSEFQTFIELRKLLKTHKPIATLSFMDKYNIFTILASRFLELNIFVSDRSNPNSENPLYLALLRRITYKYASGIVAQTTLAKEILWKKTKNKNIQVIPNPIREVALLPQVQKEKFILNIGRLVPEKGQKYLLEVFARLEEPEWKLVILGDGPLRHTLNKQAIELGIAERLIMPGSVKNVDEWLAKSSIFAFTSISEGFPNALIEAMAAGLPCISFDCEAGPKDIIEHGINGLLIEEKNVIQFTEEISSLIQNKYRSKVLGKNAQKARCNYNREIIGSRYLSFLLDN